MTRRPPPTRRLAADLRDLARGLAFWLALGPLLALSLIASGTMAVADGRGGLTLVLCTGDGPLEVTIASDGTRTPVPEHDRHGSAAPCLWSLHAQPLLAAAPLPGAVLAPAVSAADPATPAPRRVLRPLNPATSARGPPAPV